VLPAVQGAGVTSSLLPVLPGASGNSQQPSPGCRTRLARALRQARPAQAEKAAPHVTQPSDPASLMLPPVAGGTSRQRGWGDLDCSPLHCTASSRDGRGSKAARTAALFIRIVPAVIVVVALPAARHAAVVLAAELVRLTGALVCEGRNRDRRQHCQCTRGGTGMPASGAGSAALRQSPSNPALPMRSGKRAANTSPSFRHSRDEEGTGSVRAA